ncbi:MAG: SRPBCC family protein [Cyclobacteriaceae bacterium]
MERTLKILAMGLLAGFTFSASAQKKVQTFTVSKVFPFSAEQVWAVVGEDYGRIAYSHPKIIASDYINGSLKAGEGAERVCYFNEKQTQYLKEKMINYSPDNMRFTNTVYQAGKFPVDPEYTKAIYSVKEVAPGKSELTFDMKFRTKPAFMGPMAKGKFKRLINDYFIAIEHHVKTGENVTKENFKQIKKLYTKTDSKQQERVALAMTYKLY